MVYFTYILHSESINHYYVGATQDDSKRLENHLWNHQGVTSKAKDWEVKYSVYQARSEAYAGNARLKSEKAEK